MKKQDDKAISTIRHELLCKMHKHEDIILESLKMRVTELEFHAAKYKEKEVYDRLLDMKSAFNTIKCYFQVTHNENCGH